MLWLKLIGFIAGAILRRASPALGTALFQMRAIVQPEKQHIVDVKREIKEDEDDDGDGKSKTPRETKASAPLD
jgi:hypothetical protein